MSSIAVFPGSTLSRGDLLARVHDLETPYPKETSEINDRFVANLETVPGETLGEIRANADLQSAALYRKRLTRAIPMLASATLGTACVGGTVTGLLAAHPFAAIGLMGLGATFLIMPSVARVIEREAAPRNVSQGVVRWGAYLAQTTSPAS
jgi:hypothetical protein